ncbi:MAG: hypothetical protein AB1714_04735 [Acidobacteriota bacterium]
MGNAGRWEVQLQERVVAVPLPGGWRATEQPIPQGVAIGDRHRTLLVYDPELRQCRLDLVMATGDRVRAVCQNAQAGRQLTHSSHIANVIEAGWIEPDLYYQLSDLTPSAEELRVGKAVDDV